MDAITAALKAALETSSQETNAALCDALEEYARRFPRSYAGIKRPARDLIQAMVEATDAKPGMQIND